MASPRQPGGRRGAFGAGSRRPRERGRRAGPGRQSSTAVIVAGWSLGAVALIAASLFALSGGCDQQPPRRKKAQAGKAVRRPAPPQTKSSAKMPAETAGESQTKPVPTARPLAESPAPVATSAAPVTTSAAPVATSAAPVATSAAPVATSSAPGARSLDVWAIGEGMRINPLTGKAIEGDSKTTPGGIKGNYKQKNLIWDKAAKTISLKGCANEVLGFQLILEGAGVKNINISATELVGKRNRKIPAKQLSFFRAFYIHVAKKKSSRTKFPLPSGWFPDPLVPFSTPKIGAPFAIDGSNFGGKQPYGIKNQTVWVDLWIPKNTPKGTYKGNLVIHSSAGKISLNTNVEVFGFSMPDKDHMTLEMQTYKDHIKMPESPRNQVFIHAHQHRATISVTSYHITDYFEPKMTAFKNGKFNWEGFDKFYGPAIDGSLYKTGPRAGVPAAFFNLPFGPALSRPDKRNKYSAKVAWPILNPTKNDQFEVDFTPEYVKKFSALLKDASQHFAKKYPKTIIVSYSNVIDELGFHKKPKNMAMGQMRTVQGYAKLFKPFKNMQLKLDIGSGLMRNRWDLNGNGKMEGPKEVTDVLADVGLWSVNGKRIDLKVMAPLTKRGIPVWFYNGYEPRVGPTAIGGEGVGPRTWPWVAWNSAGVTGIQVWSCLEGYSRRPWKTGGGEKSAAGQSMYFYPGKDVGVPGKVFVSMRLKAFRRGLQDYEYLYLLSKKDGKKDRANFYSTRVVRNSVNLKLDIILLDDDDVEIKAIELSDKDSRHWSHNPEHFEAVRYKIGEILGK